MILNDYSGIVNSRNILDYFDFNGRPLVEKKRGSSNKSDFTKCPYSDSRNNSQYINKSALDNLYSTINKTLILQQLITSEYIKNSVHNKILYLDLYNLAVFGRTFPLLLVEQKNSKFRSKNIPLFVSGHYKACRGVSDLLLQSLMTGVLHKNEVADINKLINILHKRKLLINGSEACAASELLIKKFLGSCLGINHNFTNKENQLDEESGINQVKNSIPKNLLYSVLIKQSEFIILCLYILYYSLELMNQKKDIPVNKNIPKHKDENLFKALKTYASILVTKESITSSRLMENYYNLCFDNSSDSYSLSILERTIDLLHNNKTKCIKIDSPLQNPENNSSLFKLEDYIHSTNDKNYDILLKHIKLMLKSINKKISTILD